MANGSLENTDQLVICLLTIQLMNQSGMCPPQPTDLDQDPGPSRTLGSIDMLGVSQILYTIASQNWTVHEYETGPEGCPMNRMNVCSAKICRSLLPICVSDRIESIRIIFVAIQFPVAHHRMMTGFSSKLDPPCFMAPYSMRNDAPPLVFIQHTRRTILYLSI